MTGCVWEKFEIFNKKGGVLLTVSQSAPLYFFNKLAQPTPESTFG